MSALEDILAEPIGAQFYRADLHIHSYGASHDVRDLTMTAEAIVATAAQEGLSVIAITDHNEIGNVEPALLAAQNSGVYVVPAIELSTPQGHLLCYLPTLDALRRLHGQLSIVDRGTATCRCQHSILDCLNLLPALGGFGVLAHIDVQSGFEIEVPGASPHKFDVLCHPALLGIELKLATSTISYADGDPDPDRVRMGRERIKRLKLGSKQNFGTSIEFGRARASGTWSQCSKRKQGVLDTRWKRRLLTACVLRLEDADARVRIEDQIPQAVPRILGVTLDGGFLSGEVVHFSSNLNCIIGGRGTGKSTAIEAVRCLVGHVE